MAEILTYFLIAIALIWVIAASVSDLKKREVPDWLNFSLIAIALSSRLIFSLIENNFSFILWGVIYLGIFFLLANIFYYSRIFAGGDAKLLIGLGAVLAVPPQLTNFDSLFTLPVTFIMNLFFIGSIYGLLLTISTAYKNKEKFVNEFRKKKKGLKTKLFILIALIFFSVAIFTNTYLFIIISVFFISVPYIYLAIKSIEKVGMIFKVSPKQLTEGDWIVDPIKVRGKVIKPAWEGLSKKDLVLLKKSGKKVLVKYGLPFVPAFLLALIATLFFGNILELILMAFF